MVCKRKSSDIGKSTSELVNHTSKSNFFAQIDLKLNNADVEKTTKVENRKTEPLSFPKHQKLLKSVHGARRAFFYWGFFLYKKNDKRLIWYRSFKHIGLKSDRFQNIISTSNEKLNSAENSVSDHCINFFAALTIKGLILWAKVRWSTLKLQCSYVNKGISVLCLPRARVLKAKI